MGGEFRVMEIGGHKNLEKKFKKIKQQCEYDRGHDSYNGTWSTLNDIQVIKDPTKGKNWTKKKKEAMEDWFEENCEKWGNALAVKTTKGYIVGGICAC